MDHHTSPQPAPASLLQLPNAIQPLTPTKLCAVCGQEALKRCARCRITYYCCEDCQDSDWSTHLQSCVERKPSLMAKRLHFDEDKAPLLSLLSDLRTSTAGQDGLILCVCVNVLNSRLPIPQKTNTRALSKSELSLKCQRQLPRVPSPVLQRCRRNRLSFASTTTIAASSSRACSTG